jgi:energy-coupling factor transport system permease protein
MLFLASFLIALWALPLPYPGILAIGIVLLIWVAAEIKPTEYLTIILFLLPIMFMITLIQLLSGPAPRYPLVVGGVPLFSISVPGAITGLKVALRLGAMAIAFVGFSMTTDPFHWGMSLHRIGLPYKVAYMFGFAMRFFPLLQEEMATVGDALKARASDTVGTHNPVKALKGVGQMVVPLGLSALSRSQTIALAMELRGYSLPEQLGIRRTMYRVVAFSWRDVVVWLFSLAMLAGVFLILRSGS